MSLLSICMSSIALLQPFSIVFCAYHIRLFWSASLSNKEILLLQGICATTSCTISKSGQHSANFRIYLIFLGENPDISGKASFKSSTRKYHPIFILSHPLSIIQFFFPAILLIFIIFKNVLLSMEQNTVFQKAPKPNEKCFLIPFRCRYLPFTCSPAPISHRLLYGQSPETYRTLSPSQSHTHSPADTSHPWPG